MSPSVWFLLLAAVVLIVSVCIRRRDGAGRIVFEFDPPSERSPSMLRLTTIQKATATARFQNAGGQDRDVDGIPVWAVEDENIATLQVAADGRSAVVIAGAAGSTRVFVTADAKVGEGFEELTGSFDVEVSEDQAVQIVFEFDDPVLKSE